MAKKENPNLIFRKEWWDFLRWEPDETVGKTMRLLCDDYFGHKPFNTEQFEGTNIPQAHEKLAIPMVKSASLEKESYIAKCEKLKANASKSKQLLSIGSNCEQLGGNTIQYNTIQDNSFFSREETSPEKEKKEILFSLSFFFLAKGVLRPYTTAEKAWNYNESQGWKFTNKNGSVKDCSKNKLAFLKGWDCEGLQYPLDQGDFFACFCQVTGLLTPEVLDDFHGCHPSGDAFYFLFDHKKTADTFNAFFKSTPDALDKAHDFVRQTHPQCTRGFKATLYKQE